MEELKNRLEKRETESQVMIEERLLWAINEMKEISNYHYCIINDYLETAYQVLKSIFIAEEHRVNIRRNHGKTRKFDQ